MRKLIILATKYSNTKEAMETFEKRKWVPVRDESTIPKIKRIVSTGKHSSPLMDLEWEEIEYGEE